MVMVLKYLSAVLLLLSLSACAIPHKQLDNNPAFTTHQYNSSDINLSWKSEELNDALLINGTISNATANRIYNSVTLEAAILGKQGKVLGKKTIEFSPIKFEGPQSFKMSIPLENDMQPERIKFNYRYAIDEDHFSLYFESLP